MKSFEHEVLGNTRDDIRPRPAGLSRRELFLKGGVAIAVTQALGAEANAADATRKIALEEHFTTAELAKSYVARPTRSDTLFADIERRLADFDQLRLETMDKAGIDLAVLSVTTPGVQAEKDTNTAIKLAREANDLLAREVQKRPQRYAGFAHLPTQDGGAAAAELERAVKDLRFKGALINGQTNGKYLDADMYLPFWERVQDLDVPIYLHPGELADHPAMFAGRPELNGPVWAWTADTGAHALRLVFAGTFTRFPKLKIILGHMGETLPFLLWRSTAAGNWSSGKTSSRTRGRPPSSSGTSRSPRRASATQGRLLKPSGRSARTMSCSRSTIPTRTRKSLRPSSNPHRSARKCAPRSATATPSGF